VAEPSTAWEQEHNMKDESYIIAFTQGSAGRFVLYLLTNLLTDSLDALKLCPITNSTHQSDWARYTGYTNANIIDPSDERNFGNSHPEIWNRFKFDNPLLEPNSPKIFSTHRFPDFSLIKDRLGPNVKIILVTIDPLDLKEVIINDKLKNYHDILTGHAREVRNFKLVIPELAQRYKRFLGKPFPGKFIKEDIIKIGKGLAAESADYYFFKNLTKGGRVKIKNVEDEDFDTRIGQYLSLPSDIDYPMDQILFLPYNEIASFNGNGSVWLSKLEKFTNKTANSVTKQSYQRYIDGRSQLLKEWKF
jgi:hypothetical protein